MDFKPEVDKPNIYTYGHYRVRFEYFMDLDGPVDQVRAFVESVPGAEERLVFLDEKFASKSEAEAAIKAAAKQALDQRG